MKFFPRVWYYAKTSARRSYAVCVSAGERLAWFFGITKPKYHAEIQRYENMNEQVERFVYEKSCSCPWIICRNDKYGEKPFKILNMQIIFGIRSYVTDDLTIHSLIFFLHLLEINQADEWLDLITIVNSPLLSILIQIWNKLCSSLSFSEHFNYSPTEIRKRSKVFIWHGTMLFIFNSIGTINIIDSYSMIGLLHKEESAWYRHTYP